MVSTAATHANDAMKRIEKFKKLLEVQESLGGTVDLVGPTRELLKEGKIVKISARSCEHQDRYLFLVCCEKELYILDPNIPPKCYILYFFSNEYLLYMKSDILLLLIFRYANKQTADFV